MKDWFSFRQLSRVAAISFFGTLGASAADHFGLSVGARDMLVVTDASGAIKSELPVPSISESVTINGTSFQVSYGRDANNLLTAILSPNPAQPQDLHFAVLGKQVDSDKLAVVTLTFSKDATQVRIDPGYVGEVQVNSRSLQHDSAEHRPIQRVDDAVASDASPDTAARVGSHIAVAAATTEDAAAAPPVTVPVADPVLTQAANQPANVTDGDATDGAVSDHSPLPMQANDASQMPFTATATPGPSTVGVAGPEISPRQHTLYWAEPITAPDGSHPACGPNEMKLVELQGSVSVIPPGGSSIDGANGMVVPSGSTITTADGSSVALFMGGVNSVRLMPETEVQITQQLNGPVRKTELALHKGTIFNRVGHRDGETQKYQVESQDGVAVAKGTEFADSIGSGHHYVFVVKGVVATIMNGIQTGNLTPTDTHLAFGAMPPADDGAKVLFSVLTALQPFQSKLHGIIADINKGTATPTELGYFDSLRNTFSVAVDDVYDPTHPNSPLGAFTSSTGYGDSIHSSIERPQDFATPNPLNLLGPTHGVFFTAAVSQF